MDCVNGTLLSHRQLTARAWDWTLVRQTLASGDKRTELAGSGAPHTSKLVIFNRTKVRRKIITFLSQKPVVLVT